ncbi:putative winged helix-turn-helix DNA-binding domainprotein [Vibrio phage 120E34-1]|nr:putative winged helix-turn-helix DNA-binding domainprotein [Vibrio phage 120E34-1]
MDNRIERLIRDNPTLSSARIAKLVGLHRNTVINAKKRLEVDSEWFHFGVGIPFVDYDSSSTSYRVRKDGQKVYDGSFNGAMDNLDRLIYCLENNNGQLPPTRKESYFLGLGFGERL